MIKDSISSGVPGTSDSWHIIGRVISKWPPQSLVIPTISAPDFSLITSYLSGTKSFGVVILSQIVLVRKESFPRYKYLFFLSSDGV